MTSVYLMPVVRNPWRPGWRVDYVVICPWRWAFRGGGCE